MPVGYGQLGCSGFIVSDKDGNFVSRKTRAYLQFGEAAFKHVESLLAELIPAECTITPIPSALDLGHAQPSKNVPEKKKKDRKKKIEPPASVSVDSMDDEHKECTDSFNKVIEDPSTDNFQKLFDVLQFHFYHEEELIMTYSEKNETKESSSFSALDSHKMDHQRILKIAGDELERVNGCGTK